MQRRGPIELEPRCRELLTTVGTGRIGVSTPLGPQVIPVSYTVVDDAVVLWASPYSLVTRSAPGTIVAFEVDHVDPVDGRGWSGPRGTNPWRCTTAARRCEPPRTKASIRSPGEPPYRFRNRPAQHRAAPHRSGRP